MPLYDLRNEFQVKKFKAYCESLIEEKAVCELKKKHPQRSLSQNAYLHVCIGYYAAEYGCSKDECKVRFFKEEANPDIFWVERKNRKGQTVRVLRSTASLDTAEMTLAIERFRNWAVSQEVPVYIPAPHEEEMLVYAQQIIDANKEFL